MDAFEDLEVWKRSSQLAVSVYSAIRDCREHSLRDQMLRSAVSISSNIAEGFERNSDRQLAQFLFIAKGSCGELRSQLHLCKRMGLLPDESARQLLLEAVAVSKMLQGFVNRCRGRLGV